MQIILIPLSLGFYFGVVLVFICLIDFIKLQIRNSLLREIKKQPTSPINKLYPGKYAEITGTVEAVGPQLELPDTYFCPGFGNCMQKRCNK
jgi:hypothetical protein